MNGSTISFPRRGFGETSRTDVWWVKPLAVFLGLSGFIAYSTWAALQGSNYHFGGYLSPFYSPELWGGSPHAWFGGPRPSWWPGWLIFSPAMLILWAPGGFRFTCYYYRGAYYKAFWADPPSCAVGEPRKGYRGEKSFPLILQNVHRYFMYLALVFIILLASDVWKALWFTDPATGAERLGVGVGTLVLATNVVLLSGYTLGCHSFRHLIGGRLTSISARPLQYQAYQGSCRLNRRHQMWAWMSLFWVAFSDVYVRLCATGVWMDWRIL
ncbi:MAG: succinate dehydrogenase [Gemmatimonadetes bacterium]|nr:succinate dehydrogenase [Gemmatimonadota bacterium]